MSNESIKGGTSVIQMLYVSKSGSTAIVGHCRKPQMLYCMLRTDEKLLSSVHFLDIIKPQFTTTTMFLPLALLLLFHKDIFGLFFSP